MKVVRKATNKGWKKWTGGEVEEKGKIRRHWKWEVKGGKREKVARRIGGKLEVGKKTRAGQGSWKRGEEARIIREYGWERERSEAQREKRNSETDGNIVKRGERGMNRRGGGSKTTRKFTQSGMSACGGHEWKMGVVIRK